MYHQSLGLSERQYLHFLFVKSYCLDFKVATGGKSLGQWKSKSLKSHRIIH